MKNDRLKPFIHKIKGIKNYSFFDMLNGNLYHIEPVGKIEEVRNQLEEAGLIFKSETFVPFKTRLKVIKKEDNIYLRKLQVRLNGNDEDTCWQRNKIRQKKNPMTRDTIEKILKEFKGIPLLKLIIEAEYWDKDAIVSLVRGLAFEELKLVIESESGINSEEISILLGKKNIEIDTIRKVQIDEINISTYDFFYNQVFNPCLGHQIAIDTEGEIKPCLWWSNILGNIRYEKISSMIISGRFDKYWEISKDTIDVCKCCEYRYNCMDCRINTMSNYDKFKSKPIFCKYDPYTGEGKKD